MSIWVNEYMGGWVNGYMGEWVDECNYLYTHYTHIPIYPFTHILIHLYSTIATARQKAASPPLNFQGKQHRVRRRFWISGAEMSPPRFSM